MQFRRVRGADTSGERCVPRAALTNWLSVRRVNAVHVTHRFEIKPAPRTVRDFASGVVATDSAFRPEGSVRCQPQAKPGEHGERIVKAPEGDANPDRIRAAPLGLCSVSGDRFPGLRPGLTSARPVGPLPAFFRDAQHPPGFFTSKSSVSTVAIAKRKSAG